MANFLEVSTVDRWQMVFVNFTLSHGRGSFTICNPLHSSILTCHFFTIRINWYFPFWQREVDVSMHCCCGRLGRYMALEAFKQVGT
jgi:hypothetical protein